MRASNRHQTEWQTLLAVAMPILAMVIVAGLFALIAWHPFEVIIQRALHGV